MKIGIRPDEYGQAKLGKWYVGIEILKCPRYQIRVFRPFIFIWCVKWEDFGEPDRLNGREEKRKGIIKTWTSPIGIFVEITKY